MKKGDDKMNDTPKKYDKEDTPVNKILQKINTGDLDPRDLSKEQRQLCVEALYIEGHSPSAIANVLNKSEKTIKRDIKDIMLKNADAPTKEFILREIAEMMQRLKAVQGSLMRLARSKDAPTKSKVEALAKSAKIAGDLIIRLQSLGYLPERGSGQPGGAYNDTQVKEKSLSQLKNELSELIKTTKEIPGVYGEDVLNKITPIKDRIERWEIGEEMVNLEKEIKEAINKKQDNGNSE